MIFAIRLVALLRRNFARTSLNELYVLFTLVLAHFRHTSTTILESHFKFVVLLRRNFARVLNRL